MRASAWACMCAHIGAGASAYARESYKYIIYINNMRVCERVSVCGYGRGFWGARVLVQVFAVFGVGFALKSKLKMTCGAGKNRAKNGNKKAKNPHKIKTFSHFSIDK